MASKRDSKFMDAQNFIRELGYRVAKENEELQKHLAENGRDTACKQGKAASDGKERHVGG